MQLSQRDRKLIWHPFTQEKTAELPLAITSGKGAYLYTEDGTALLDLIASWWVNVHGHSHPAIAEAIYSQAQKLEHVIFAGFTHEPAVTLCEKLTAVLPSSLQRCFFSDNGSTAVEVAMKMAYQYWWNQREKRHRFLSFEGGYHGDTFGAMSVGRGSGFFAPFNDLLMQVDTLTYPHTWQDDPQCESKEQTALQQLARYLEAHSHEVIAFIAEPLVQGASGMRMVRPSFLNAVVKLLRQHGIVIIFDEVMTGFYRTGTMFAFQQLAPDALPDLLCISKGITGGFLPLALTIANEKIYEAFLGDTFAAALPHGHSYTANPLGCAAGIVSLDLLLNPSTQEAIRMINTVHLQRVPALPNVHQRRIQGTIAAFDVSRGMTEYGGQFSQQLRTEFLRQGLLLRPLGSTVYLLPPYCVTATELHHAYDQIDHILAQ